MFKNLHVSTMVMAVLLALATLPIAPATPSAETETRAAETIPAKTTGLAVEEASESPSETDRKTKTSALEKLTLKKLTLEKHVSKKPASKVSKKPASKKPALEKPTPEKPVPAPEPAPDRDLGSDKNPRRVVRAGATSAPALPGRTQKTPAERPSVTVPSATKPGPPDNRLLLSVPRLGLENVPVGDSASQAYLDREGIMHLSGTGFPHERGSNTYIAGHAEGYNTSRIPHVFRDLHNLRQGDLIVLRDVTGKTYNYRAYERLVVNPRDFWVTKPVAGKQIVSFQTCFPAPSFHKRLVVRGELVP